MSTNFMVQRLEIVRKKIDTACQRSGRSVSEVRLIGVAKGQSTEKLHEAVQSGLLEIGENYAQEMLAHSANLGQHAVQWHFIGHLQRNKVKQVLPHVSLIHSVDSLDLANEINKRAGTIGKVQPVLIEVNLGREAGKTGVQWELVHELVRSLNKLDQIDLQGFMTIPPAGPDEKKARGYFRQLREIRDEINRQNLYRNSLRNLSMGMTDDFEVAIEEGATLVRIGTGIFGPRG